MGIEFQILGPLAVRVHGREVALGGPIPCRILAMLLLNANDPVSVERLAEAAWDQAAPSNLRRQVQNRIAALRTALGGDGQSAIVTCSGSYKLRTAPDHFDALRFRRLVGSADRYAEDGDRARAAQTLRAAIGLWRGQALAGLDGVLLNTAAAVLEEERLRAWESYIDLELTAGRPARLIPELRRLIADNPLRERLVAQFMLALYRVGRRADALGAYRELADRLADELGLDPSPALRGCYEAIVREDASLNAPDPIEVVQPPPSPPVKPSQLPGPVVGFTGRATHLARLDQLLPDRSATDTALVSVVSGTAGVGKTALVTHWAHRVRDRFPDGQLYIDLRGYAVMPALAPMDALAQFLRALGVAPDRVPAGLDEAAGLYRSLLADKRLLVLLDNANTADQVRPLLPGAPGCLVLVTSRDQLTGLVAREGAHRLSLDVLTPDEAMALLVRLLGAQRIHAEPEASTQLAELCAFLPLALRVAAARLSEYPGGSVEAFTAGMRDGDRLAALSVDGDEQAAVRAAFGLSYGALPATARRMFRLLGLVPGPDMTADAAASLARMSAVEAGRLLDHLARAHLLERRVPGRYAFHDLVRLYANECAREEEAEPDRQAATGRLFEYYLRHADAAVRLLVPGKVRLSSSPTDDTSRAAAFADHTQAAAWLDAERANLVAAVARAAEHPAQPMAWLLADAVRFYLDLRANAVDWLSVSGAALAAARVRGDRRAQAAAHLSLADLHWRQGRHAPSLECATQAIALAREVGWPQGQAAGLANLGVLASDTGRLAEAVDHIGQALALYRQTGHLGGQAFNAGNLAAVYWDLGRLRQAAEQYTHALELHRQVGSRIGEAVHLSNLGEVWHVLGHPDTALEYLTRAVDLHRELGDRRYETNTLRILAELHADTGRQVQAMELASTSLDAARELGRRRLEAYALNTFATVCQRGGDTAAALEHHARALRLAGDTGDLYPRTQALIGLATAHSQLGDWQQALAHLDDALEVSRRIGYRMLEGQALTCLAAVQLATDETEPAGRTIEQALAIHRDTGHRRWQARSLVIQGQVRHHGGHTHAAQLCWQDALTVFIDIQAPEANEIGALVSPTPETN